MDKKDRKKLIVVFLVILGMAILADSRSAGRNADGSILRGDIGEETKGLELTYRLNGEDTEYDYRLEVAPIQISEEMAQKYFSQATEAIDTAFEAYKASEGKVGVLPMEAEYCDGIVEAQWQTAPKGLVTRDGRVVTKALAEGDRIVTIRAHLYCGEYEKFYEFPLKLTPVILGEREQFLESMESWTATEMEAQGKDRLTLPQELDGVAVEWKQKKEHLTWKILLLEGAAVLAIFFLGKRKTAQEERARRRELEMDYPELVSQLTLLLGAGMPQRQVWKQIAAGYIHKRDRGQLKPSLVYEEILLMVHRMSEGESERSAYLHFAEKMNLMCYHRLIRILIGNLEKGAKGVCELLEQEMQQAYEQRLLHAKKLGEEASTRMLLPLMMMLMVVMAVVLLPAMISFAM